MKMDCIKEHWNNRRFNHGMTKKEVHALLKTLKIHHKKFWAKFGVNTCAVDETGEVLHYLCDIELAVLCCVENRDKYQWEWD